VEGGDRSWFGMGIYLIRGKKEKTSRLETGKKRMVGQIGPQLNLNSDKRDKKEKKQYLKELLGVTGHRDDEKGDNDAGI